MIDLLKQSELEVLACGDKEELRELIRNEAATATRKGRRMRCEI
jgi:hypothetical protein